MRQAILVKFLGPTNSSGSRYKATAQAGSVTVGADHGMGSDGNAAAAAEKLCKKLGWSGRLAGGGLPNGDACFVFVD